MHHRVPRLRAIVRRLAGLLPPYDDRGQATAEYALIVLAAGGIAIGVITWVGRTHAFTDLFESVLNKLAQ